MRRGIILMAAAMLLIGSAAWAAVCPLCLEQIPDGEKLCARHKAELAARAASAGEEERLIEALAASRQQYEKDLKALEEYYKIRGSAEGLNKIQAEVKSFEETRHFTDMNWEDKLPMLEATTENPEANKLLADADVLVGKWNPVGRGSRIKEAATKYQEILIKYPTSTVVDDAAYALGDIYSGGSVREYSRGVRFYELAYLSNPAGMTKALFRAAQVCDDDLAEYESAARFYWMASKADSSAVVRKRASVRLKSLQKGGFGKTYSDAPAATDDTSEAK